MSYFGFRWQCHLHCDVNSSELSVHCPPADSSPSASSLGCGHSSLSYKLQASPVAGQTGSPHAENAGRTTEVSRPVWRASCDAPGLSKETTRKKVRSHTALILIIMSAHFSIKIPAEKKQLSLGLDFHLFYLIGQVFSSYLPAVSNGNILFWPTKKMSTHTHTHTETLVRWDKVFNPPEGTDTTQTVLILTFWPGQLLTRHKMSIRRQFLLSNPCVFHPSLSPLQTWVWEQRAFSCEGGRIS